MRSTQIIINENLLNIIVIKLRRYFIVSNGKGLAILALLVGISGLGLSAYSVIIVPAQIGETSTFGIQLIRFGTAHY